MPKGLQKVADIMPLTQGIKLLKAITFREESGILYMVLLLTAIFIIGIFIAVRYFRWE
jgi:ABC-2 type transport system permease protein